MQFKKICQVHQIVELNQLPRTPMTFVKGEVQMVCYECDKIENGRGEKSGEIFLARGKKNLLDLRLFLSKNKSCLLLFAASPITLFFMLLELYLDPPISRKEKTIPQKTRLFKLL